MPKLINANIVTDILTIMSEQLEVSLFLVDNVLEERENVQFLDTSKYREVAGLVLKLDMNDDSDASTDATLEHAKNRETYLEERKVILRYLLTHIAAELQGNRVEARDAFIEVMKSTVKTFNPEFVNVLLLLLLFDGEHEYRYVCRTVADYAINILYREEEKGGL